MSQKSLSRIINQQAETRSFTPKSKRRCGRKLKMTQRDIAVLIRNSKHDSKKSSFDHQKNLQHSRLRISFTTVRRQLLEVGRKARKPLKKHFLTKTIKQKRLV